MFSKDETIRYQRHFVLNGVGLEGQQRLKDAHVLIVGMGGLGCPAAQYLVAAGVGNLTLVDHDTVSLSNLQRQTLYASTDLDRQKVDAASDQLTALNPNVKIEKVSQPLTSENAIALVQKADVIIDGTDNLSAKYLINDACVQCDKPMVFASIYKYQGQFSVFNYQNGPTYRCVFPDEADTPDSCEQVGVLGPLPGILGSMQAAETLKIILGIGAVLSGKMKIIDMLTGEDHVVHFERNETEVERIKAGNPLDPQTIGMKDSRVFLDVREAFEQPRLETNNVIEIPLRELIKRHDEIPRKDRVVVCCQSGIRSRQAIDLLEEKFGFENLEDLPGGIKTYYYE